MDEELQERLEQAAATLENLEKVKGELTAAQEESLRQANGFLGSLNEANVRLAELQKKFEQLQAAKGESMVIDREEAERVQARIEQQERLATFQIRSQQKLQELTEKSSEINQKLSQQQASLVGNAEQSTQRVAQIAGRTIKATQQSVSDLTDGLAGADNKFGLVLLAALGGTEKLREAVKGIKNLPITLDEADAAFNKALFSQDNFASSLIAASTGGQAFASVFGDNVPEALAAQMNSFSSAGVRADDYKAALASLLQQSVLFKTNLIPGNEEAAASTTSLFAAFEALGVKGGDLNKILNNLTVGLDMSVEETQVFDRELFTLGKTLGVGGKIFNDAANTLGMLQGQSNDVTTSFKGLAVQAAATGADTLDLASKAAKFNEFDAAAKAVQSVNAALGDQVLDFTELLEAPIEDKFVIIRQRLAEAGVSFNDLSFQARKIISESLGFSNVGEAAKQLSETAAASFEKVSSGASDAAASNKELSDQIIATQTAAEKPIAALEAKAIAGAAEVVPALQDATKEFGDIVRDVFAGLEGQADSDQLANIIGVAQGINLLASNVTNLQELAKDPMSVENVKNAVMGGITTFFLNTELGADTATDLGNFIEGQGKPGSATQQVVDFARTFADPDNSPEVLAERRRLNPELTIVNTPAEVPELNATINLNLDDNTLQTISTRVAPEVAARVTEQRDRASQGLPVSNVP